MPVTVFCQEMLQRGGCATVQAGYTLPPPNPVSSASPGDTILSMFEAGLGVALKSWRDVQGAVVARRLTRLLPDWAQADSADIMIVTPGRRLVSATLRAFLNLS